MRVSPELAHRFVYNRVLPTRARHPGISKSRNQQQYRLARSRSRCARLCPWPVVPQQGQLIAIGDALVKYMEGAWWTWYFILVRAVDGDEAIILPPYCQRGTETTGAWYKAFDALDPCIHARIEALVADGHRGLVYEAKWRD